MTDVDPSHHLEAGRIVGLPPYKPWPWYRYLLDKALRRGGRDVTDPETCACGRPLHYSDPAIRAAVEAAHPDSHVVVQVDGRRWKVQRHYIALHGLRAADLPLLAQRLGFQEVTLFDA